MRFTNCSVPTISSVSPYNITYETELTIRGTDFSSIECENEIYIGGKLCSINSVSSTELKCTIGKNSGLTAFKNHSIEVKVKNKGYALKTDNFIFVQFLAIANEITPSVGSTNGGALVTINGDGFDQSTKVIMNDLVYDSSNSQILFDSFKFITLPNTGEQNLFVFLNENQVEYAMNLTYEFTELKNPQITSISTNEIQQETNLTLNGENFGIAPSDIDLKIGDQTCEPVSLNDTNILCSIKGLEIGSHSVKLNVKSIGNANEFGEKISGMPTVTSIDPISGSNNGGTLVKIKGNGFTVGSVVNIGQSICKVKNVQINEIECETQANAAQTVNVSVSTLGNDHLSSNVVYTFDSSKTPVINNVDPVNENYKSSVLTLTGENFSNQKDEVHVNINGLICSVITSTLTEITCTIGEHSAGTYPIELKIDSFGYANKNFNFVYNLNIHDLSSNEASLAGGLHLKINGSGFSQKSLVSICNNECKLLNYTSSQIYCLVPPSNSLVDKDCVLEIVENGLSVQTDFYYKLSLTPTIFSSWPKRGGTGGGTILTISGQNFK